MPEKKREISIRRIASKVLKNTEMSIGVMYSVPLLRKSTTHNARVEKRVTILVVAVSPRHFPTTTSVREIGFGKSKKKVRRSISL